MDDTKKYMMTLQPRKQWNINPKEITVMDNFFTTECLKILKYRILYAGHWDKQYSDYYAIDYFPHQDYISSLIANELKEKLGLPEFIRGWSFVYNNESNGVHLHCDPSLINLNIWLTDTECVKNSSKNGLLIYKVKPPSNWSRDEWNTYDSKAKEYVASKNIDPIKIEYKSNRAIFFDGAYFHSSDGVSMKEGMENKRVSFTMLFGKQLEQ